MKRLLVEVAGLVEAPPDRVSDLILTVREGDVGEDNAWLFQEDAGAATLSGGPERFAFKATAHSGTVDVDRGRGTIAFQGGWWYRGEYRVESHPTGTRLVLRVYNAATRARWAVPLANKGFAGFTERTRAGFAGTLDRIGTDLDCRARLED